MRPPRNIWLHLLKLNQHQITNANNSVRRILNLAARNWRDENGRTWLETPPLIKLLPLVGFQRESRPMTWNDQRRLFAELLEHLLSMALFDLNTGVRDEVVCGLKWEWEVEIPELETSVFLVPKKGRKHDRVLVCNLVAKQVIDAQRAYKASMFLLTKATESTP